MVKFEQPWDEEKMQRATLSWVRAMPRAPLSEPGNRYSPGPGLYLLWIASDNPMFGRLGTGESCAYAGAALSLKARLGRHKTSFREAEGLSVEEVWVGTAPTSSLGAALYAEWLALREMRPVLNELSGLGSMRQGRNRSGGQQPSLFDSLWPRGWGRAPSPVERGIAAARLGALLAEPGRLRNLWRPLV